MKRRKFLRSNTRNFKRLMRRKKQKWRRARGRHSKIREKKKGKMKKVMVGFRTNKKERGKIDGKIPIFVGNLKQAENIEKGSLVIIKKIGRQKREIIKKKIKEKGGEILNFGG